MVNSFNNLPFELMQHIASFLGTPFVASKAVTVNARKLPYDTIFESYQKTIGSAKCDALVNDLIARKEPLIRAVKYPTNEQKMRALCKDIGKRCKLLDDGENYLAEKNLNPIFSPSQYQEIEKWIADENLLKICYRLLGDAWDRIDGTHEQCAQIARKMIAENCQKYTRLDLNDLGLTQVPPELFTFPNLTYLNLSNNKLTTFKVPQGAFQSLASMYLNDNQLSTFESAVGSLPVLTLLELNNNLLTTFNALADEFPRLNVLNLDNNLLGNFNAEIGAFPRLKNLRMMDNTLTTFEIAVGAFPLLEQFDLRNNQLTIFNAVPGAFPRLDLLHLSANQLTAFDAAPNTFPLLEIFSLHHNKLTIFTAEPGVYPSLLLLTLGHNQLTTFTAANGSFPNLEQVTIYHNPLANLNIESAAMPRISTIGKTRLYNCLSLKHKYRPRYWRHIVYSPEIILGGFSLGFLAVMSLADQVHKHYY